MSTKDHILSTLEQKKGEFVSGEVLAEACGVSRSAVWKGISELKKKGYRIRSVNNRGYLLETDNDIISRVGSCNFLSLRNAVFWENREGRERIHVFDQLDSTNNEAKRSLLFSGSRMAHGTVFVARCQTAGKGHDNTDFSSPEGGIYLSIILDPKDLRQFPAFSEKPRKRDGKYAADLSEAIGKNVEKVLGEDYGVQIERRKNSTFYEGNRKICGILTEGICDIETGVFSNFIVGIGIYAEQFGLPADGVKEKNAVIADLIQSLLEL